MEFLLIDLYIWKSATKNVRAAEPCRMCSWAHELIVIRRWTWMHQRMMNKNMNATQTSGRQTIQNFCSNLHTYSQNIRAHSPWEFFREVQTSCLLGVNLSLLNSHGFARTGNIHVIASNSSVCTLSQMWPREWFGCVVALELMAGIWCGLPFYSFLLLWTMETHANDCERWFLCLKFWRSTSICFSEKSLANRVVSMWRVFHDLTISCTVWGTSMICTILYYFICSYIIQNQPVIYNLKHSKEFNALWIMRFHSDST